MARRRSAQAAGQPADLPAERAYSLLRQQLAKLQELKGHDYVEVAAAEEEWRQFTETIVLRAFGSKAAITRISEWPKMQASISWFRMMLVYLIS